MCTGTRTSFTPASATVHAGGGPAVTGDARGGCAVNRPESSRSRSRQWNWVAPAAAAAARPGRAPSRGAPSGGRRQRRQRGCAPAPRRCWAPTGGPARAPTRYAPPPRAEGGEPPRLGVHGRWVRDHIHSTSKGGQSWGTIKRTPATFTSTTKHAGRYHCCKLAPHARMDLLTVSQWESSVATPGLANSPLPLAAYPPFGAPGHTRSPQQRLCLSAKGHTVRQFYSPMRGGFPRVRQPYLPPDLLIPRATRETLAPQPLRCPRRVAGVARLGGCRPSRLVGDGAASRLPRCRAATAAAVATRRAVPVFRGLRGCPPRNVC